MLDRVNRWFWNVCSMFFRLRYHVHVLGDKDLVSINGPSIVLANHPAYVDPPLLMSWLRFNTSLRPLVFSKTFRFFLFRPLFAMMRAIEVPDLSVHRPKAMQEGLLSL